MRKHDIIRNFINKNFIYEDEIRDLGHFPEIQKMKRKGTDYVCIGPWNEGTKMDGYSGKLLGVILYHNKNIYWPNGEFKETETVFCEYLRIAGITPLIRGVILKGDDEDYLVRRPTYKDLNMATDEGFFGEMSLEDVREFWAYDIITRRHVRGKYRRVFSE